MNKVKLYKPFEKWYRGGVIWIYSDPHFSDPDRYLIDKNWPSDEEQVAMINHCLGRNDTIIFLGDIGNIEVAKQIRGYKVLILGNHDKGASNYIKSYTVHSPGKPDFVTTDLDKAEYDREYRICETSNANVRISNDHLFDEVYEGPLMINDHIMLSHEPVELGFGINIHGHEHRRSKVYKRISPSTVRFNVCSNIIGYHKLRLDELLMGVEYDDLHRLVIDKAIIRKRDIDVQSNR